MIDTDKYKGHSTGWKHKINHSTYSIINDDGHKVASIGACVDWQKDKSNIDSQLIADAPLLLAEVKRLREELALYEKYAICHPDGTHCCDECLERNGFEVIDNVDISN